MDHSRWVRKKGGGWIIAVPAEVRDWFRISHHVKLYWHMVRRGEAVLTLAPARKAGAPDMTRVTRELAAARAEIAAIQRRDELRDRSMYAEGFAHGYVQATARLTMPDGPSAERGHRRKMWRWAFPEAASVEDPKQLAPRPAPARSRMNARTRRAKRDERLARRAVETYQLPAAPEAPASTTPGPTSEGATAPEVESPALPVET